MYHEHFGLNQPPFKITPNQEFFFPGGNRGAMLDAMAYAIISGEGIIKVVGEVGSGKTMLCRALENRLPIFIDIIYLPNPSLPHDEILYAIADELGLTHLAEQKPAQIIRGLQNHLIEKHAQGWQVVVFIDEAQAMPLESLEAIRLLSNLETDSSKLLQIVLFGQPELDRHINQPQIRQLKERITHSFYLLPFSRNEIDRYLIHRMRAAGYRGPHVFSQAAIRLIYKASQGLIRRVNILADKALLAAFSDDTHAVTVKQVKAAIRDSNYSSQPTSPFARLALAALLLAGILAATAWAVMEWPAAAPQRQPPPIQAPPVAAKAEPLAATPAAEYVPRHEAIEAPLPFAAPASAPLANQAPDSRQAKPAAPPAQIAPAAIEPPPRETQEAPPQNPLQPRLEASSEWLKGQNGAHFAIQLMVVAPEAVEVELGRIQAQLPPGSGQLVVYNKTLHNKTLAAIAIGAFPSAIEAGAARANLPATYLNYRPMLRTIKSIRALK